MNTRIDGEKIKFIANKYMNYFIVLLGVLVALFILNSASNTAASDRLQRTNVQIANMHNEIEAAKHFHSLSPVVMNWEQLQEISNRFDVDLLPVEGPIKPAYLGPANAWHWVMRGDLKDVAAVIYLSQQKIPLFVGELSYQSGRVTVSISVLGSLS